MRRVLTLVILLTLAPFQAWAQPELRSGGKGTSTASPVTSTPAGANKELLDVILRDANGDTVSVGGGTQYSQGTAATDTDTLTLAGCVRADTAAVATGVADGDRARCIVDSSGRLWVNVGNTVTVTGPLTDAQLRATAVPVSGTVTANAGTGTFTVDGSGVTQPISGTVTANAGTNLNTSSLLTTTAHDAAFGTAGSADAQVRSVQGIAGGTALPISGTVTADAGTNLNTSALLTTTAHDAAFGTAGSADSQVRSVQGIAGGTALPVSGTVTANAGTGNFASRVVSGTYVDASGNVLTIKTAFGRPSSSGNNAFITAVAGKKIRVLGYRIQASGTVNVKFTDTAGSPADLSQLWEFQAREGVHALAPTGAFEFESSAGLGVQVNLSAAVAANITVIYVEVD